MKTTYITEPYESLKINEDTVVCDNENQVYAVFDGATSLSGFKDKNGYSGGYIAANIAKQISDSIILMIYKDGSHKIFGEKRNHDQGLMLLLKDLKHRPVDNAKEIIMKYVFDLRNRSNIDYGFLNGESEAAKFIAHGRVKLSELSYIVLFSDGLIPLVNDPEFDPQYDEFIKLYTQSGVEGVKDWIRNLENSDTDCNKFIRYKAHDDISIIGITLNS